MNWLRVLGTAELPHIDQGVRQQFHAKMSLLNMFKTQEESLELVLPRKSPIHTSSQGMDRFIEQTLSSSPIHTSSQGMDRFIEQTLSSPLPVLSIARILFDVGDHAGIENALAIVRGIKASVEIQIGSSKVQTGRFGYPL